MARGPYFTYRPGGFSDRLFGGDPLVTLQRELNRVFDELDLPQRAAAQGASAATGSLSVDVSETSEALKVCADLPGVAEDDLDITLNDDTLTLRGERKPERREEKETVHVLERSTGAFQRSVRLPFPVDPDRVRAEFNQGVLTVTLPKLRASDKSRKIRVQTASGSTSAASGGGSGAGGFTQGDGAQGASPSTGVGAEPAPAADVENAAKPGGAVHGYNE
jgi:HSP20 family protein